MLLVEELQALLHKEIAIIMSDGQAYRGKLVKFDKDIIIMKEIYETTNQEIDWVETKGSGKSTTIKGYIPWRKVTLPRLIARVDTIMRIWPWTPGDPKKVKK